MNLIKGVRDCTRDRAIMQFGARVANRMHVHFVVRLVVLG